MEDIIQFDPEWKTIHLTPFKYLICSLINTFSYADMLGPELKRDFTINVYFETIQNLTTQVEFEINKTELIPYISSQIKQICTNNNVSSAFDIKYYTSTFISAVNTSLSRIEKINDLFYFFEKTLTSLRINKSIIQGREILFDNGGTLHTYIYKCLTSYKKASFGDLIILYESLILYRRNEKIKVSLSIKESDKWFDEYFSTLNSNNYEVNLNDFKNFPQKFFFEIRSKSKNTPDNELYDKIWSLHTFFDFNYKYVFDYLTRLPKMHYSLIYFVQLYYDLGYYDKALEVLYESIQFSQSNNDYEAVLKCFLWQSKCHIQKGDYDIAAQLLTSCLIKAFQNNFQLWYFISSIELSNLNFIFHSNIGLHSTINALDVNEKILSVSNNGAQWLKNISDYYTLKSNDTKENVGVWIHSVSNHLIWTHFKKGYFALGLEFLKLSLPQIFNTDSKHRLNNDFLSSILSWSMNAIEYDFDSCISITFSIANIYQITTSNYNDYITRIIVNKYLCECVEYTQSPFDYDDFKGVGVFYQIVNEYLNFLHWYHCEKISPEYAEELSVFITKCKDLNINAVKRKSLILLARYYIQVDRVTEGIVILEKIVQNTNTTMINEKVSANIILAYAYHAMKQEDLAEEILKELEDKVEIFGCISTKYDYYYLRWLLGQKGGPVIEKCLKLAIMLNNKIKMKKIMDVLKGENKERKNLTWKTIENFWYRKVDHYICIWNSFQNTLIIKEVLEWLYIINKNITAFIGSNTISDWLNKGS